ncbi:hypothetical protein PROFUN_02043 [Planoprotostelium fungivorum]|uniref:Uncharacterized protein n=1 Tax=Planoprotostelium fungivorum TaxID=1890364 RepID=A0A2P6NB85_9EUKA|nr:hypothetical protein PROFUN_02043 [Planoprotostelium fungivorum]
MNVFKPPTQFSCFFLSCACSSCVSQLRLHQDNKGRINGSCEPKRGDQRLLPFVWGVRHVDHFLRC